MAAGSTKAEFVYRQVHPTAFLDSNDSDSLSSGLGLPLVRLQNDTGSSSNSVSQSGLTPKQQQHRAAADLGENSDPDKSRWRRGCYTLYRLGICKDKSCAYAHDLDNAELSHFLKWKNQRGHVLFQSNSGDQSNSGEHSKDSRSTETDGSDLGCLNVDDTDAENEQQSRNKRLQYQELQRQLRRDFKGMDDETLARSLPLQENGLPSSMGSTLHKSGNCRPCRHMMISQTCPEGTRCLFCHLQHKMPSQVIDSQLASLGEDHELEDKKRRERHRPCKSKRDQYKKIVKTFEDEILKDPFGFNIESVKVPPRIFASPELTSKFMRRLESISEAARRATGSNAEQGSGAAASSSFHVSDYVGPPPAGTFQDNVRMRNLVSL
mmetsp:Transcript_73068/g.144895  ORF Transcript_73068/g.144895 Transcript_73068/m.144895 type:complete len:379 (-) Transcript_73068:76-1212(-)